MARNEYKYEYGVLVSSLPPGRVKVKKLGKSEYWERNLWKINLLLDVLMRSIAENFRLFLF